MFMRKTKNTYGYRLQKNVYRFILKLDTKRSSLRIWMNCGNMYISLLRVVIRCVKMSNFVECQRRDK